MILEDIKAYHANGATSHSKLETFRRRPALYFKKYVAKTIKSEAPGTAFRIGSAAHAMVLEPLGWTSRYAIKPEGLDRRTKDGKAQWESFVAENVGKEIIEQDEAAQVTAITEAVRVNPLAAQVFGRGEPELTWRTSGAMPLQCRTDWFNEHGCELSEGRPYVADLKTVESLDGEDFSNFERSVYKYGYHRQAGFYLPLVTEIFGRPVFDFFFVAVEKIEPFGVAVYRLTDDAVALGQDETVADLRRLKACMESNEWPNIPAELRTLGVPAWYKTGGAE